jgi:hypothetical protein
VSAISDTLTPLLITPFPPGFWYTKGWTWDGKTDWMSPVGEIANQDIPFRAEAAASSPHSQTLPPSPPSSILLPWVQCRWGPDTRRRRAFKSLPVARSKPTIQTNSVKGDDNTMTTCPGCGDRTRLGISNSTAPHS